GQNLWILYSVCSVLFRLFRNLPLTQNYRPFGNRLISMNPQSTIVHVSLDERSYDITIADGALSQTGEIARAALGSKTRRLAIISNPKVHALYGKTVERSLRQAGFATLTHPIGDGERAKSLRTAERAWGFLIANRFERSDGVVALGGGVVGDLAGFVAAT